MPNKRAPIKAGRPIDATHVHRDKKKIIPGDLNDIARKRQDHMTPPATEDYRKGWDLIWGKKNKKEKVA